MTELQLLDAFDPNVEPLWRALEQEAKPSYFLSWAWIENWLASLPAEEAPPLAAVTDDGALVAACFLGRREVRRHGVVKSSMLYLNTTGNERCDDLCIEHNGILRSPSARVGLDTVIGLLPDGWDELHLPAVDRSVLSELGSLDGKLRVRIEREAAAPFVDLELVRAIPGGYLSLVTPAIRGLIRRSQREVGPVDIEAATDEAHGLDILDELSRLQREQRGTSAFDDPWFAGVHRRLVRQRIGHGDIQLVRLRAHGHTIGCLYNFAYAGRVIVYQSGLARFSDPHIRPELMCHVAAIESNAEAGLAIYDLVACDSLEKQRIATGDTRLLWLRVQRKLARFSVENTLRGWKDVLRRWRQRRTDVGVPSHA
ncbi:MAG TPA: GNAT family N-acetyltransferase [Kofleriaceae bacterium]|nr:GNAT family N-acetyltransferase [Kofleriaceae bacterium]